MKAWLLAVCLCLPWCLAMAGGKVTHLSGGVSVQKPNVAAVTAQSGTAVDEGDTVITGGTGYVRMEMTDGGEIILRPNSQLKIERYAFTQAKPKEDSFVFRMLKGGLRTVTGLIGKRGDQDAYQARTDTATIGIRGTQFDLRVCAGNCGAIADGTYVAVRFGAIATSNSQGTLNVAAGQVAYVPALKPPVVLPRDPGIGFTPPAVIPKLDEKKKLEAAKAAATDGGPKAGGDAPANKDVGGKETNKDAAGKDSVKDDEKPAQGSPLPVSGSNAPGAGGVECTVE